jgi:hypothetical protein
MTVLSLSKQEFRRLDVLLGVQSGRQRVADACALLSPHRLSRCRLDGDAIREFSYDRTPSIGQLDKAFDETNARGWTVVDMKNDWRRVFPFE